MIIGKWLLYGVSSFILLDRYSQCLYINFFLSAQNVAEVLPHK